MPYRIAGIDVHKKMLAVVVVDVDVAGLFAAGETVEAVSSEYELSVEQIRAALAYAAHTAAHLPPAVRPAS